MADKVIPIKKSDLPEVSQAWMHNSCPTLCNSKVLNNSTAPGIRMYYDRLAKLLSIEYRGKKFDMPDTNITLIDYK